MSATRLTGTVYQHNQRGRSLGYPTANIKIDNSEVKDGIYVALAEFARTDAKTLIVHQGVAFIGAPIMFNDQQRRAEMYILDFSGDLYGKQLTIHLLQKLRDNQDFDSTDALIVQIEKDIAQTRAYFQDHPSSFVL